MRGLDSGSAMLWHLILSCVGGCMAPPLLTTTQAAMACWVRMHARARLHRQLPQLCLSVATAAALN